MKKSKHQENIKNTGESKGWKVTLWSVDVGCRGFPAVSLRNYLRDIGYSGAELLIRSRWVAYSFSNSNWYTD